MQKKYNTQNIDLMIKVNSKLVKLYNGSVQIKLSPNVNKTNSILFGGY